MSCNGCRVLRKGCSEDCSIRPCIQWIKNPESQGNATLFLAKFYGRAGLINLIDSGPQQFRPAIFRSLLYEACGRMVNPIHGSVGLMWSGNWNICEAAVDAVLRGSPIAAIPNFRAYDIRHVSKPPGPSARTQRVIKNHARFRRSAHQTGLIEPVLNIKEIEDDEEDVVNVEASNVIQVEDEKMETGVEEKESGLNLMLRLTPPSPST